MRRPHRSHLQLEVLCAPDRRGQSAERNQARAARAAAVGNAYEPLVGLVQLGGAGGGLVWVGEPGEDGAEDSPALDGFALPDNERQEFLGLVQQFRVRNPVRGGASGRRCFGASLRRPSTSPPQRFESACDDLDSGLFELNLDQHCYCCMQFFGGAGSSRSLKQNGHVWCRLCSYQVHGLGTRGGQHRDFATAARPNDRCPAGCPGCTA